jgi:glyoxylase-like metal-dependent hydrolase (beta-lactamase superfamily II)
MATEVAPGIYRLGSDMINWYLVDDGGRVTVVDAGVPGYWPQIDEGLNQIGRSRGDVAALILTHGDGDHVGVAERIRREFDVPVYLHPADKPLAEEKKRKKTGGNPVSLLMHGAGRRILREFIRQKALSYEKVAETKPIAEGDTLDVPGNPAVVATPGHTNGHVVFHFPQHGVVLAGDALCTWNPIFGGTGPQLMPKAFNISTAQALESLGKIEQLEAQTVLVGHGEPWTGGTLEAVNRARTAPQR